MPEPRDPDLVQIIARLDRDGGELQRQVDARWGRVPLLAADPASPPAGGIWIRSDTGELRYKPNGVTVALDARHLSATGGGRATVVADQTGITTIVDLTGFTVTFTAVAGRTYNVFYTFGSAQVTTAGAQTFRLSDGAADLGIAYSTNALFNPAGSSTMVSGVFPVSGLSAGAHTLKLRGSTSAGTMTIPNASTVNGRFVVVDGGT